MPLRDCTNCRHAKLVNAFSVCTRYPPRVEVIMTERSVTLRSWYTPIARVPCAEHRFRLAFWRNLRKPNDKSE
jgi:hypothetical protein